MEKFKIYLKRWLPPEDRRGFPGVAAWESSMQAGGGELCDGHMYKVCSRPFQDHGTSIFDS